METERAVHRAWHDAFSSPKLVLKVDSVLPINRLHGA